MKTRLLLSGLMLAFLSSCAMQPVRVDSSANDLEVLRLGVKAIAKKREPVGVIKRSEDAERNGDAWNLLLDVEDALFMSEDDKQRLVQFVIDATHVIERSRAPACKWWQWGCRRTQPTKGN